MKNIYKVSKNKLIRIEKEEKHTWVHLQSPSREEIDALCEEHQIPVDFVNDALDPDELARTETEGRWLYIIIRVPIWDEEAEIPYYTIPFGILISTDSLITVCAKSSGPIDDFIAGKIKQFDPTNKLRFVMQVFLRSAVYYLRYLKAINKEAEETQVTIRHSLKNEKLINLLELEKSLVFFAASLKSNELLIEKLQKSRFFRLSSEEQDLLDDVLNETKQAIEMANIYSNILSGMMTAFSSLISNNVNIVVKALTSITILLMIPNLVASLYGMNVDLPFERSPNAFLTIILLSVFLTVIGFFIFRRRDFF